MAILCGVLAGVIVIAGVGFWTWHEQPSFCGTACHDTMQPYVSTYNQAENASGYDKWGSEVSSTQSMMVVTHAAAGENCLACHEPTLSQQIGELGVQLAGNYTLPLPEADNESLMVNSGHDAGTGDAACLKSGCHDESRSDLTARTAGLAFNPHDWHHNNIQCSDCHKSHRASVLYCTQCHENANAILPDGWLPYQESLTLEKATGNPSAQDPE